MKHLYFVRHGLSGMNVAGIWSGHTETPLTKEGRLQATRAGQKFAAEGVKIDHMISSPLSSARDTAEIIAKEIGYPAKSIEINPLFLERHFGALEGQPWEPDLNMDGIADIETTDTILNRARQALNYLESLPYDTILVVAHGTIGRAIRHHIYEDMPFHDLTRRLENAIVHRWR